MLVGDKIVRLRQELAINKNVTNNARHLPLLGKDVEPINDTYNKARIGIFRQDTFDRCEESQEHKIYRTKLLESIKK